MNEKDCIDLGLLLSKGYPLSHALIMVDSKYQSLLNKIEAGDAFTDYLDERHASFFFKTMKLFTSFTSLSQSILSARQLKEMKQSLEKQMISQCSYPMMILLLAILIFFLFESFIYPQIISFIEIEEMMLHQYLFIGLRMIMIIMIILLIVGIIGYLYLNKKPTYKKQFYLNHIVSIPFIKKLISYQLATYLVTLMNQGFSTQQIITSLSKCKINDCMNWLLDDMSTQFEKGISWLQIIETSQYFHPRFIYFFKIGLYLSELSSTLQDYLQFQKDDFKRTVKHFSWCITLFSYVSIALLVLTIYQVILMPLEMIERM